MEIIRKSSENEMILTFLQGELCSKRFGTKLLSVLEELNYNTSIIEHGDLFDCEETAARKQILGKFRGYPNEDMFENFPDIERWDFVQFEGKDLEHIYYIDYSYWNELSNHTSKPCEAAKNIREGREIFNVPNTSFLNGAEAIEHTTFPPVILITCNNEDFLIIEGHSRMTVYGLKPEKFPETYGLVGHCTKEEMAKYDQRMI